jgi:uncharacterized membrane protein YkoI
MDTRMTTTRKRWLMGAGAGTLLLVGGLAAGPVAGLAQDDPKADLREDEAVQIAINEHPNTTANHVELDDEDGRAVYEISLSNGYEVEVDGSDGRILDTETDGDDDDRDDDRDDRDDDEDDRAEAGTLDDGASLLPEASISLEQAITAAQAAADGTLGEVDLEYVGERLVFNVDIGNNDVKVDAADGSIVSVDSDD